MAVHPNPLPQERESARRALGSSNVSVVIAARNQFGEERTSTRDIRLAQTRRTVLPLPQERVSTRTPP